MLVSTRGLGRTYHTIRGPIVAVDGVDLEIEPGEFVVICGRSGSGKSTLLGMIGGLCRPSAGLVSIGGTDLHALSPKGLADFRARRLGFLFQFAGLLPNLRAIDNVALPALLGAVEQPDAYERARDLLGQVGLAERWDAYPGELSGGQQRRVAVARALINRPALLLADEPTNDLDEQAEWEVLSLLQDLHRSHATTLVVVTHDQALAARADRVVTLRSGRIVSAPRPAHVLAEVASRNAAVAVADSAPAGPDGPFEAGPDALAAVVPTPPGAGFVRFLLGFLGWVAVAAGALYACDTLSARFQGQAIERRVTERKKAEELAMQQLRADIHDVVYQPDGGYEVTIYLENFAPDKPFYVLGPELRAFVQVDRGWQPIPIRRADPDNDNDRVQDVRGGRRLVPFTLRIDIDRYDELIAGYFHLRLTSVMVVSESAEPTDDLFERTDDYYVYLKPQRLSDDDIRARNQWKPGAIVPRWIPMPAH
ncbi:putative ABC transport system ATP-binding protein/macrolide transport system ATP-binding/permease protein/lipoprotein-releasing system ATP-binding protein [Singulisphaera sp. GP187]|uniref:ABC transporter ATP-binding protein n=1 Tax=Singulisphaera sp. GP187 TaxID=1882752 RepID=UPI00092B3A46|nr:ABC transporter ATP-binding protein [Singulisphaera sp. GP187]SIO35232.1 putative ABC transport system ATP-binding protein/macrolide transport system ATP-binding/permease protein/lipoprotein-releasing system ATP-binding protein [Singulisphaera sp. GP187]